MNINEILKTYDDKLKASGLTLPTQNAKRCIFLRWVISLYTDKINSDEVTLLGLENYIKQDIT